MALAALILLQDLRADDIGRHQVRGALDLLIVEAEDGAQRLHQPSLRETRHADQKRMTPRKYGYQCLINHLALAEDHPLNLFADITEFRAQRIHIRDELGVARRGV